jgi:FkbM family methyltransferase
VQAFGADGSEHEAIFHDHVYKFRNARIPMHESGWYFHSEEVLRHKHWNIEPGQVVADVGACFGSYTITALLQGAHVYAFEPHPQLYNELVHNVWLNRLNGRFNSYNKAVWSTSDTVLDLPQFDLSMKRFTNDNQPILKVQTMTLDDLFEHFIHLDWIKIDVEGAEIEVLRGARQVIEKHNPKILVEWHADRNKDPELNYLKDFAKVELLEPGHYLVQFR